jgi:hypothetical protein
MYVNENYSIDYRITTKTDANDNRSHLDLKHKLTNFLLRAIRLNSDYMDFFTKLITDISVDSSALVIGFNAEVIDT